MNLHPPGMNTNRIIPCSVFIQTKNGFPQWTDQQSIMTSDAILLRPLFFRKASRYGMIIWFTHYES